jgi:pyridoxine/pyridoxamine 5'-phosphate oxidase
MMEAMMDTQLISEQLASLKQEIHDLRETDAHYQSRNEHTQVGIAAHLSRQSRLLQIKQELWGMMERAATSREYSVTAHRPRH